MRPASIGVGGAGADALDQMMGEDAEPVGFLRGFGGRRPPPGCRGRSRPAALPAGTQRCRDAAAGHLSPRRATVAAIERDQHPAGSFCFSSHSRNVRTFSAVK